MTKVKIKGVIQADLSSIKNELIENSEVFIKKLIESLRLIKDKTFSAYKVDLSLNYLKKVYESAFPSVKHGGTRTSKSKRPTNSVRNSTPEQVVFGATWSKSIPLVDKAIVINLFRGITFRKKAPSFVELIALRSGLSNRAIHNRIRVGNYIANCREENKSLLLFRSDKISRTKFLAEIIRKEKFF